MNRSRSELGEMLGLSYKREVAWRILDSLSQFWSNPFANVVRVADATIWELMERYGIAVQPGVDYAKHVRLNKMPLWKDCFIESTSVDPDRHAARFAVKDGDVLSIPGHKDIILTFPKD